ncbi:nicotinate mononucleotide-dependent phosphoribosyltransferase CobT [Natrinema sp. 1APR25-10V2]|uniref:nicotinate mononucleotide-dependent phosphoribosyltransferase CobT n=1 Tax=Natrinema sp. 1APR25-10V2 TaxID=2951081 RepID=UPI0028771FFC|nr:TIGR00303 family protein [Natrinema sp. 1APR25-10V2]MDS0475862.1 TIGR00303 family protein [Natrinema sp. 1APR25-10V2]
MRVLLPAGTTETALIDGISAAGAAPELMEHTPAADVEILAYGEPTASPVTPVSPNGCPTPAAVTRAVREVVGFDVAVIDAGLTQSTAAPTVDLGVQPGNDIREPVAVPSANAAFDRAYDYGASLPDDGILIGETVPGGTTTALGVLTALGEPSGVSSSLPENPIERKRRVVDEALAASDLEAGDCDGAPLEAIAAVGDPVQPTVAGIATGALEAGTDVTLAGGTQMVAVAAALRHAGVDEPLSIATTSFVADEQGDRLAEACERFDCDLTVTDPGFDGRDHVAMERYCAGEAKEGVAMGGALSLVPSGRMNEVRDRLETVCARLGIEGEPADDPSVGSDTDAGDAPEGDRGP